MWFKINPSMEYFIRKSKSLLFHHTILLNSTHDTILKLLKLFVKVKTNRQYIICCIKVRPKKLGILSISKRLYCFVRFRNQHVVF